MSNSPDYDDSVETIEREEVKLAEPKMFKVYLLNDDFTTMDFVVGVLERIFRKSAAEATRIMLEVHNRGRGVCGMYPRQIAETKIQLVHQSAKREGHPLRCSMEEV